MSVITTFKGHKFYDPGIYSISETSNAKTRGGAIYLEYDLSNNVSITGGYGFAVIDSLGYQNDFTSKASFHQFDLNIGYHLFDPASFIRPHLFFGYSYNKIPQLSSLNELPSGVNSNFGAGLRVAVSPGIHLEANSAYAFSYAENIRYNFRHQIGVVLTPRALIENRGNNSKANDTRYKLLLKDNRDLSITNDSMKRELVRKDEAINSKENSGLLVAYNNSLNERVRQLEIENQRLLDEIRYRRFTLDSQLNAQHGLLQVIDSAGNKKEVTLQEFKPGWYLLRSGIETQDDAEEILMKSPYEAIETIYLLTAMNEFQTIGWLSEDKEEAEKKLKAYNNGTNLFTLKKL